MDDLDYYETEDAELGEGFELDDWHQDDDAVVPAEGYEPPGITNSLADQQLSDRCESLIMSLDTTWG